MIIVYNQYGYEDDKAEERHIDFTTPIGIIIRSLLFSIINWLFIVIAIMLLFTDFPIATAFMSYLFGNPVTKYITFLCINSPQYGH